MNPVLGNAIVIGILAVIVFLAGRSLLKRRRSGGCCSGNCLGCSGCKPAREIKK